jgi:hypothetical protein
MTDGDPKTAVEHEPAPQRRRVRVKKRITPRFHFGRRRQQLLSALVIAVAAAVVVAWFAGASLDNPEAYIPGGAVR